MGFNLGIDVNVNETEGLCKIYTAILLGFDTMKKNNYSSKKQEDG